MNKLLLTAALVGAAVLSPLSAVAQETSVAIRSVDTDDFPTVAVTVSVPNNEAIGAHDVVVTESGDEITEFEMHSLAGSGQLVSVVLVIDTSGSMVGAPLAAAKAAAATFVDGLPDFVRVGVLTFSDELHVLVPVTPDHDRALNAIEGVVAAGETSLYDAVRRATDMFPSEGQRNIVLLSDGGDTASSGTLAQAARAAARSKAAVYAVGLDTGEADVPALKTIAGRSGGRYAPAGTADLGDVYEGLAEELSGQFVLVYESESPGGGEVTLEVATPAGSDDVLFLAPRLAAPRAEADIRTIPEARPLLDSDVSLVLVVVTTFAGAFLLLNMVLGAGARRRRDETLAERFALGRKDSDDPVEPEGVMRWVPAGIVSAAEQVAGGQDTNAKLDKKIERAGWPLRPAEFLALNFCTALAGLLVGLITREPALFVLLVALGVGAPHAALRFAAYRRLHRLQDQLPDILGVLASSLRAGHSFLQALDAVAKEIGGAGSQEFARVIAEIRLGRPIEDALNDLAARVDSKDFRWAVLAVNIQRSVGGNLAEVLDTVADTIRERQVVRRQVKALSAEGRLSMMILIALPFLMAGYMAAVNPEYIGLLVTTTIGLVMLAVSSVLLIAGVLWMRKVVRVDV